jgi:hypothetical protein
VDTREELQRVVASVGEGAIVITDQEVAGRVVKVGPKSGVRNVSIALVAGRISPKGEVMVRIRNQSGEKSAGLVVNGARTEVELPAMGQTQDYFLPVEAGAKVVKLEVEVSDDFAADNVAHLVRRGAWPVIEVRRPVGAELQRVVEQYSRLRPSSSESKRVGIGDEDAEIVLGKIGAGASGAVTVAEHPIISAVARVDWSAMAADGVAELPAGDWKALVRVGERAVVAVSEKPGRRVWVGVDTRKMAASPEFVIFWSSVFDWVGDGGEEFAARMTGRMERSFVLVEGHLGNLEPGWWPGLYRRPDGEMVAVNVPDVVVPAPRQSDWRSALAKLAREHRNGGGVRWLTTWLILGAMGLMLVAAMTWRGGIKKHGQVKTAAPAHAAAS